MNSTIFIRFNLLIISCKSRLLISKLFSQAKFPDTKTMQIYIFSKYLAMHSTLKVENFLIQKSKTTYIQTLFIICKLQALTLFNISHKKNRDLLLFPSVEIPKGCFITGGNSVCKTLKSELCKDLLLGIISKSVSTNLQVQL